MRRRTSLGVYRKSHIPDGPGYMEKFYFRPGDTGFKVWRTRRRARSASASAGINGSRKPRAPWLLKAPRSCSTRRPSAREPHDATLDTPRLAARDAGPCGLERHAGRRRQPHRRSRRTTARRRAITATPSSPTTTASLSRASAPRRGRAGGEIRPRRDRALPRRMGLFPRPPDRPLRQKPRLALTDSSTTMRCRAPSARRTSGRLDRAKRA